MTEMEEIRLMLEGLSNPSERRETMDEIEEAAELAASMSHLIATHLKHNEWTWETEALFKVLDERIDHIYAEIATLNSEVRTHAEAEARIQVVGQGEQVDA